MRELTEAQARSRRMWAAGDYGAISFLIADAGRTAVATAGVTSGERVLDVACGTGNATIPAAERGAVTTGLDLTPELLERGRAAAAAAGVDVEWVEGDAEALPFEDASFDVVLSVFGCMFAPDHHAAAREIARVLRPGGRAVICSWTPDGAVGAFFKASAAYMPPPPEGFQPPVMWGNEDHVRGLFSGTDLELTCHERAVEFVFPSAEAFFVEYETKFGPVVTAKLVLEPAGRWDAFRDEMIELFESFNTSGDGDLRYSSTYLVTQGRKTA